MTFALDTNIVSELLRQQPNPNVINWLQANADDVALTSPTVMELRYGARRMPLGRNRTSLVAKLDALLAGFGDRILPFDAVAADIAGRLRAEHEAAGRTLPLADCLIAATCLAHGAILASRNIKDFEGLGVELVDPFAG